jgi:hypothetical protein
MAYCRSGHYGEARHWLERIRAYRPEADPARPLKDPENSFWEDLEIRLLRSEAEAVILYDPIFPDDPFAP